MCRRDWGEAGIEVSYEKKRQNVSQKSVITGSASVIRGGNIRGTVCSESNQKKHASNKCWQDRSLSTWLWADAPTMAAVLGKHYLIEGDHDTSYECVTRPPASCTSKPCKASVILFATDEVFSNMFFGVGDFKLKGDSLSIIHLNHLRFYTKCDFFWKIYKNKNL